MQLNNAWNQHRKWINMSITKPNFGPVVLEIAFESCNNLPKLNLKVLGVHRGDLCLEQAALWLFGTNHLMGWQQTSCLSKQS